MFSSLSFPKQSGEQIVSQAVTGAIASLFKKTGKLQADLKAEPIAKLFQGSVDGFNFVGSGMQMYNGLRLEGMELYLKAVSIDFGSIFNGKVKLRQPTEASMRIVLTENDLTSSFNTAFIIEKLQKLSYQGHSLNFSNTAIEINADKSLNLTSAIALGDTGEIINVHIKGNIALEGRTKIQLTNVELKGNDQAQSLSQLLVDHVNNLLDLDKFTLNGSNLRVDRLTIRDKELIFYGTAEINHFPQK